MTRLANLAGRAVLLTAEGGIDVEKGSDGLFAADPQALYDRWDEFRMWAAAPEPGVTGYFEVHEGQLLAPAPSPRQVFGIGLNYSDHAAETDQQLSERVAIFTKFPTCITGGFTEVLLPEGNVDWEVELVVVMGRRAHKLAEWEAWSHVAGVTVGQDLSERVLQRAAGMQYCLAKSYPGFGPMGPWLVTPDELTAPDDLALSCSVNGEVVQASRTSKMVFGVPRLVEELSRVVPLLPGDVIFTGTPAGVGVARRPPRFLQPGDVVESRIEGIGSIRNRMIAG